MSMSINIRFGNTLHPHLNCMKAKILKGMRKILSFCSLHQINVIVSQKLLQIEHYINMFNSLVGKRHLQAAPGPRSEQTVFFVGS